MRTLVGAVGALLIVCAGVSAEEGSLARLSVANHAEVPLAIGVEEKMRLILIYDHSDDRVVPLPAGAEVNLVLPPGRYRVVLNDRPTRTTFPVLLQVETEIEFRVPPPDGEGIYVSIRGGREVFFDGPLDQLGEIASSSERGDEPRPPKEEWREYNWKRSEAEEPQPPAFFSCSMHPWVTSTGADSCPLCGMGMDREW